MGCSGLTWCEVFSSPVTEGNLVFLYDCSGGAVESQWSTTSIWVLNIHKCHGAETRGTPGHRSQSRSPPAVPTALILDVHEKMGKTQAKSLSNCTELKSNLACFNSCSHSITHMTPSVRWDNELQSLGRKKTSLHLIRDTWHVNG